MKTVWKVLIGILAAILVLFIAAEAGTRAYIGSQMRDQAPEGTEVSFGASPLTLGMLSGTIPHITVTTPSTLVVNGDDTTGQPASTVEMDSIKVDASGKSVADTLTATTEVPSEFVRAMLNTQLQQNIGSDFLSALINVSEVTTSPEDGTFTVEFSGGAAAVSLRPEIDDAGGFSVQAVDTSLFGNTLPDEISSAITEALTNGVAEYTDQTMRITGFDVVPGGLRVTMQGHNVDFAELQAYQQ